MITHIIYLIQGRKVGCTRNLKNRKLMYRHLENSIPDIEILEELYDKTDQEAGDIEWQWADALGYDRGLHYTTTGGYKDLTAQQRIVAGQKGSREQKAIAGRIGGSKSSGIRKLPIERRSEIGRNAGRRCVELKKGSQFKRGRCPQCGLESTMVTLRRWHFDNCKVLPR